MAFQLLEKFSVRLGHNSAWNNGYGSIWLEPSPSFSILATDGSPVMVALMANKYGSALSLNKTTI
jgi:hypothetical protein